jgi:RNA polymerase sigma factor (sigma-70 family)
MASLGKRDERHETEETGADSLEHLAKPRTEDDRVDRGDLEKGQTRSGFSDAADENLRRRTVVKYRALGYRVAAVPPGAEEPNWPPDTEGALEKFCKGGSSYNLAVAARGLTVVEVGNDGDPHLLDDLIAQGAPAQTTPGGTTQLFFQLPQQYSWLVGWVDVAADVRMRGGWTLVAPSKGADGSEYRWVHGRDLISSPDSLPELPPCVSAKLEQFATRREQFTALVANAGPGLRRAASGDGCTANDLVQDMWARVWARYSTQPIDVTTAYLRRACFLAAVDEHRKNARRIQTVHSDIDVPSPDNVEREVMRRELRQLLENKLAQLSPEEGEIVVKVVIERVPKTELARQLGRTGPGIAYKLMKALGKLRNKLGDSYKDGL